MLPVEAAPHRALVLLAEDNDDHVLLTQLAFQRAGVPADIEVVRDGVECIDYLLRRNGREGARPPDLLLLDLHMPRLGGAEVLQAIASNGSLRQLPVVVLTTSENPQDVMRMYGLRASSYICKPVNFESFTQRIGAFSTYWFQTVVLPGWPKS